MSIVKSVFLKRNDFSFGLQTLFEVQHFQSLLFYATTTQIRKSSSEHANLGCQEE